MTQRVIRLASAIMLAAVCSPTLGAELVEEFTGTGSTTTAEFEVRAPWILDWRVNSDYQQSMAIEISLVDGKTGYLVGLVVQTKRPGDGVRLFNEGGSYRVRISSTLARWDIKIEELTPAEAELYTPKKRGLL